MNYTIIGHTPDNLSYDRRGDYGWRQGEWISPPGEIETQFFREDKKAEFLRAWAHAKYHNTYEDLIILLDGVPDNHLEDAEYEQYQCLEREMEPLLEIIAVEHMAAVKARKEAAAEAALQKAREIEADLRERDLIQFEALRRKLGMP